MIYLNHRLYSLHRLFARNYNGVQGIMYSVLLSSKRIRYTLLFSRKDKHSLHLRQCLFSHVTGAYD